MTTSGDKSPVQDLLHAACDRAVDGFTGGSVEVPLPEELSVQDLHAVVTAWRDMGWSVDADSGTGRLVLS